MNKLSRKRWRRKLFKIVLPILTDKFADDMRNYVDAAHDIADKSVWLADEAIVQLEIAEKEDMR